MVRSDDDLCDIVNGSNNNPLYNLFIKQISSYGNILDPCPVSVC